MTGLNAEDARRMLELSFEPLGDGYVFYRNRWSPGIPVSAPEREAYLSELAPFSASQRAFLASIKGREPVAPPRGGRASWLIVDALPGPVPWVLLAFAGYAGSRAVRTALPWLQLGLAAAAVMFLAAALLILVRRSRVRSRPS